MPRKKVVVGSSGWSKPDFTMTKKTNKNFVLKYHGALLYAHYELSSLDLKKEVLKYLKTVDPKHPFIDRVKQIHEIRFSVVGKYLYILNHGGDIPDDIFPNVMSALETVLNDEEAKAVSIQAELDLNKNHDPVVVKVGPTIQDRLLERAREAAGDIEGWVDDFCLDRKAEVKTVEEFVNLFRIFELKAPHMRHMTNIFTKRAEEVATAAAGKDSYLNDGYSNFSKAQLKRFDLFHKNLLSACLMLQEVAKVERVPKKKKPVSLEKLVAKLKYKKEDTTLGIVSSSPVQILGSREVWIYNTRTRKLSQYKALDERGLSVKGTSLVNHSSESVEKTLRKPADTLADFKKASKVKLRTFLKDLSTVDVCPNGKLNEHCVILRIDK